MKKVISLSSIAAILFSQTGCVSGASNQEENFPYATQEIKQQLAEKLLEEKGPIPSDYFETINYIPLMQQMMQQGPSVFGEKEEQQVFWYYLMRLRLLILYYTYPRAVDDWGILVEQLNAIGTPARTFMEQHAQEGQDLFASVIAYEEKYPYNPQKGIDEKRAKLKEQLQALSTDKPEEKPSPASRATPGMITFPNTPSGEELSFSFEEFEKLSRQEFKEKLGFPAEQIDSLSDEDFARMKQFAIESQKIFEQDLKPWQIIEKIKDLNTRYHDIVEKGLGQAKVEVNLSISVTDDKKSERLQQELDSLEDVPEKFPAVRAQILQAFKNDLAQMKSGLSPEEYAAKELGIMDYELALTMHPFYPIVPFFSVLYLDDQEQQAAELPNRPDVGWTYQFPSHISGSARPLPRKLDMVYYSAVEGKCYSLQVALPTDTLKELFLQKTEDGERLYQDITFGAAPFGAVAMWVQRSDNYQVQLVGWLQGQETEVPYEEFAKGFHRIGGKDWQEFRENMLKEYPQAAENLAKNGVPEKDLFEQFNTKYNTKIAVVFKASPKQEESPEEVKVSSVRLTYFNGETEEINQAQTDGTLRAKPKAVEIHFTDGKNKNSAYLYVPYQTGQNNLTLHRIYEKVFGADHNQSGQLTFTFNGYSQPWTVTLSAGDKQEEIFWEEIRFRNEFESYRTPVYYQPESNWKGTLPPEDSQTPGINPEKINEPDANGETPLIRAVRTHSEELVTKLLATGADVNLRSSGTGETALSAACSMGEAEFVKQLIAAQADVNLAEGQSGMTPLMLAAQTGHAEIVNMLLEAGADVNAPHMMNGQNLGYNALKYAQENNQTEVVNLLLAKGAQEPQAPAAPSAGTASSVDQALMMGDTAQVKALLLQGADPNAQIPGVGSVLLFACTSGNQEAAQALIEAKADVNAVGSNGFTPLMMAAQLGNKELAEMLIKAGADVNIAHQINGQPSGLNALKMAQNGGFTEIADLLKAAGAQE